MTESAASSLVAFPVVGVGASAGGLEAFVELFRHISHDSGMAFVLIQHLDPTHPSYLCDALARSTGFPVHEIQDGMRVEPDHVYVIPPNADVGILQGALTLVPRPTEARRPHLPVDFFFSALAADREHRAIGVILSGTGSDGTEGLRAIKVEGGVTLAQEPQSAKFAGMPEAAIAAGVADFALPIPELAGELQRIGHHPFLSTPSDQAVLAGPSDDGELAKVLVILRGASGVDFSEYKLPSIRRRLARRMALQRLTTLHDYVQRLRDDRAEAAALFEDILIHVTSFFRDAEAYAKLGEQVFPEILKHKRGGGTIRIWSAGCSSGEEAYSLVISLLEFLAHENASDVPIQLFGTDVSDKAIEDARVGVYSETAVRGVGAERLARFFTRVEGGGYRISKAVRERCAFMKHDLARDPPFSKLDLVSCRNVLIYFGPELQKRVLGTLHFALNYPGFLLLGHAENITAGADLFSPIDKEAKIFARTAARSKLHITPARDMVPSAKAPAEPITRALSPESLIRQVENRLLDQYAPPGVIVNGRMEILRFRGRTGPYLEPAPGEPQHDLVKMARPGLVADLRIAISQAEKDGTPVRRAGVRVDQNGSTRVCDVVVIPVASSPDSRDRLFAVLFEDQQPAAAPVDATLPVQALPAAKARNDDARVAKLEAELGATKAHLQSIIEEHLRTNDELMSANEELVSTNEELQSLNEELETAKEELQSTNEELSTLNEELQTRNVELDAVNSDLLNILGSVEVPIVIVDGQRRIRRFTPKARPILNLRPSDVGRPINDMKPALEIEDLDHKIADVIDTVASHEEEVRGRNGEWYRLQIRPYTTIDKKIDGAVISVIDIDVLKRALGAAEWARDYAKATVEAVQMPLVVLDVGHDVVSANQAFRDHFAVGGAELEGRSFYALLNSAWDVPALRPALARVFEASERFEGLEVERELPRLGMRVMFLSGRAVPMPSGGKLALLAVEDITDRRRTEAERERLLAETNAAKASAEQANRAKDQFLAMLSHELRTPLSTLLMQAQFLVQMRIGDARVQKAGEAIERAARAQAQLIDDLLDISRIVAGKLRMELQTVSLAAIVRAAAEVVGPSAARKHIELALELDEALAPVSGDPARLQQVVWNLLANAIKFTSEGGRVTVMVDAAADRGAIRVRDTGVGIEPSFLPHIFDRFSQENREITRSHGGLGLGLGIVRYLVEAQGGTVEAKSAGKGQGATFTVLLPLMKAALGRLGPAEPSPGRPVAATIAGARVLIVEDDPGAREALTQMLGLTDAVVRSAGSAADAMACFEEFRPELLVCDIAMPDEDGYSLLHRIRALGPERGGDAPALALTALASDEDRRRSAEAGFQMHMAKPVDVHRLVAALAQMRASPIHAES
ncbi:MAG TPA: chemotaxis protein CheB [Kofleriaceae bacterium]|jgi:two-component system CheB/CheR fusion protein|nr:chemotaxis protein CheB [Kofleriaceae bacterium]